ncbi:MAG: hypothetical protein R6T96_12130 [Longimicrobiales bacterium]
MTGPFLAKAVSYEPPPESDPIQKASRKTEQKPKIKCKTTEKCARGDPVEPNERLIAAPADRYTTESEIDSGGMATAYRVRELKHDQTVAIKVLRPDLAGAQTIIFSPTKALTQFGSRDWRHAGPPRDTLPEAPG